MILRVDHVGIAVRAIEERLRFWRDALGMSVGGREEVATEGVRVAFLPAGESRIELLEPTGPDSAVGRFLAKRGEGIHHLTLSVEDLEAVLARLRESDLETLDETPRPGAGGSRVAFVHPRAAGGVLLELVERKGARLEPGEPVLAYLREPSEKLWGVLRRADASGVVIEGLDLASFDDWTTQVERGESAFGPSMLFFPMYRVEKLLLDRASGDLPALAEKFRERTGRSVRDVLG